MKGLTLFILSVCLLVYNLIGGAIFHALESNTETQTQTATLATFREFVTSNTACVTADELETFVRAIITAYDQGVIATENTISSSLWDYGNSIFFSMTAVTTIGYGNQTPVTSGGRAFVILFALCGIPLCAVVLGGLGAKMYGLLVKFKEKEISKKHPKIEKNLKRCIIPVVGLSFLFFLPAGIFTAIENWTYGESLYYCFVTLTTIGFGDFVPGASNSDYRTVYRLLTQLYIYVGLAWVAVLINQLSSSYEDISKKIDQKAADKKNKYCLDKEKGNDEEEDENGKDNPAVKMDEIETKS